MMADGWALDVGVLIMRLVLGLSMAAHGYSKFFSGGRIGGTAKWFDSIGMEPGRVNALAAATTELGAGIALAAGFLTSLAAAAFASLMLVAVWTVHRHHGFFEMHGGWEYNLVLAGSAVAVGTIGAGRISLDQAVFRHTAVAGALHGWWGLVIATGLGLAAGTAQLATFYRPPKPTPA